VNTAPKSAPNALAADSEAIVVADGVSLAYGRQTVVHHVSLRVGRGDAIGIAGESGSGKSTLAKALVGDLTPVAGTVLVNGRPWSEIGRKDPDRRRVQMVFQDPYSALNPRMTARQTVAEVLRVQRRVPRSEVTRRAGDLLADVGMTGAAMDVRPQRLSGGMRQRVVIARAVACEPDVLVADEPTSALDVSIQAQILALLLHLRNERGLALVLVTHDLAVLKHMTNYTLVMKDGCVVEEGSTRGILEHPNHAYTQALVRARH
jgi:ABC-type glutathione transport system ATPase component